MATYTTYYNLKKPDTTDLVDIGDLNGNADKIDNALKNNATAIQNVLPSGTNVGDIIYWNGSSYVSGAISNVIPNGDDESY